MSIHDFNEKMQENAEPVALFQALQLVQENPKTVLSWEEDERVVPWDIWP